MGQNPLAKERECQYRGLTVKKPRTGPFRLKECERPLIGFQFSKQMFFAIVGKKCSGQDLIRVR
jgi:hypothetical protein